MSLFSLWQRFWELLSVVWVWINVKFHRLAFTPRILASTKEQSIAIVGDELALGIGDYVVMFENAGISRWMYQLLRSPVSSLRLQWHVLNCGEMKSSIQDWTPIIETSSSSAAGVLYQRYLSSEGQLGPARVVILLNSGLKDSPHISPTSHMTSRQYVDCMRTLILALRRQNKVVAVCTIPYCAEGTRASLWKLWVKDVNRYIVDLVRSLEDRHVVLCRLDESQFIEDIRLFSSDPAHLSSQGYKLAATAILGSISNELKAQEWRVIKSVLSPQYEEDEPSKDD